MDSNTQMFIGFLILEACVFVPLIIISLVGMIVCKAKIKRIDQELEDMDK